MIPKRRIFVLLLGLLVFGAIKLPIERQLTQDFRSQNFFQFKLSKDVRAQSGQVAFIAALSGLRAVVADALWLKAQVAWEDTQWGNLNLLLNTATSLQPRNMQFWDTAAWHMAWNASVAMMRDRNQPRETLRLKASREYMAVGEDMLLRGLKFNDDHAMLFERLGDLYSQRMGDHCRAAAAYAEAAKRPDARQYTHRRVAYELVDCPGHDWEAYYTLKALYDAGPQERLPSVLTLLDKLQKKLNIPADQQIDIKKDLEEATPRRAPAKAPPAPPQ